MDGAHDLGGMHGFGAIDRSQQVDFACPWEEQVFRLTLACGMLGKWNLDQSRSAREQMAPAAYLGSSYYEHWLHGLELLLQQSGLTRDGSQSGQINAVDVSRVAEILRRGGPTAMEAVAVALYSVGDVVQISNEHPQHHTRMPRYIRGCSGIVISHHGPHIFPDAHAKTGEKVPDHLYTVRFDGSELWGSLSSEPHTVVCVDVFESYILHESTNS